MKKRSQTAPVIKRDRNGRRASPFSFRRTPRLNFVSCQPTRRRSKKPSFRGTAEYGADGTAGGGDHIGNAGQSRKARWTLRRDALAGEASIASSVSSTS